MIARGRKTELLSLFAVLLHFGYEGFTCRYQTDGVMVDTGRLAGLRHGHYRVFRAEGDDVLHISINKSPEIAGKLFVYLDISVSSGYNRIVGLWFPACCD